MTGIQMQVTDATALASPVPRALIADDQPDVLTALRLLLRGAGYQIEAVSSPGAVALRRDAFGNGLSDQKRRERDMFLSIRVCAY